MSLCVILQNKDMIAISGDSRGCISDNDQYYMTSDDMKKIHYIGDKVIFTCGSYAVMQIIEEFEKSPDQSIQSLQSIARKCVDEFKRMKNFDLGKTRYAELVVATFEQGESVIYSISSEEDFRILRVPGDEQTAFITLGAHSNSALNILNSKFKTMENDPVELYKHIYSSLADEQVGGTMYLYAIDKNGLVQYIEYKIPDIKALKKVIFVDDLDVINNATDGIKIQRNTGTAQNPVWVDNFFINIDGKLQANELVTDKIIIKSSGDTLIDAYTRTIDFTKFNTIVGQLTADNIDATDLTVESANVTGTLTANQINLKGTDIRNTSNQQTLGIDSSGNLSIKGIITGGSITSNTSIDVTTNAKIGQSLILSESSVDGGIRWGNGSFVPSIYVDPIGGAMSIYNNNKIIHLTCSEGRINGNKILTAADTVVAKFG